MHRRSTHTNDIAPIERRAISHNLTTEHNNYAKKKKKKQSSFSLVVLEYTRLFFNSAHACSKLLHRMYKFITYSGWLTCGIWRRLNYTHLHSCTKYYSSAVCTIREEDPEIILSHYLTKKRYLISFCVHQKCPQDK